MEEKNKVQYVNILNRERIDISGVLVVLSSTDKEIYVKLEDVVGVVIGEKMTITKLVPEEKVLSVSGRIVGVSFQNQLQKKSFLKKVFK